MVVVVVVVVQTESIRPPSLQHSSLVLCVITPSTQQSISSSGSAVVVVVASQSGSSKSAPPIMQFVREHSPSVSPQKSGGTQPQALSFLQGTEVYSPPRSQGEPVNITEVSSHILSDAQSDECRV